MKAERLYGSRETLNSRYYKLYGEKDFSGRIDADRNKLKKLYITVTVIFAAAAVISIIGYFTGSSGVHLDRRGNITSVDRPAADSGRIYIDADVTAVRGRHKAEKKERLKIVPEGVEGESAGGAGDILSSETAEEKLQRQISSEVRAVNSGTEGSAILLPSELEDGTKLYWKERKENDLPYLLLAFFMSVLMIYKTADSRLKKEEEAARDSIICELPGFINKIVLLLEAGMVLSKAFVQIMDDYDRLREDGQKYYYEQLRTVRIRMRDTNSPMHIEFAAFAKRSGVRELMRLSNIINDNINKGFDLVSKLRRESEVMWFERKKRSEEKGRIAETKLTVPLMILLLVLITITIAPAMMEM
mgnify:CR=1 FL=1|jgi:Flp pilus assembly protein TadB